MHPLLVHRDFPFLITAGSAETPAACACRTLTDNTAADADNSMARTHRFTIPPPSQVVLMPIDREPSTMLQTPTCQDNANPEARDGGRDVLLARRDDSDAGGHSGLA